MYMDLFGKGIAGLVLLLLGQPVFTQTLSPVESDRLLKEGKAFIEKSKSTPTYDSSIYYLHQALHRFQKIDDPSNLLTCYNRLSSAYYNNRDYLKFQEYAQKAWEFARAHFDESDRAYLSASTNLATCFLFKEDYSKALDLFKKILEWREKDSIDYRTARAANNIGFVYHHHVGDFERASQYYSKATRLFAGADLKNQKFAAFTLSNVAYCLKEKQLPDSAYHTFQKTLDLLSQLDAGEFNDRTKWYCYQNMADIHLQKGQQDRCLHYAQKALQLVNDNKAILDPQLTYETLGNYFLQEKKYARALPYFEKAVEATRGNPEVHKPVNSACHLARALCSLQKYGTALDTLQSALQVLSPDFQNPDARTNPPVESISHKSSGLELIQTKATAFYQRHLRNGNQADLQSALENYQLASRIINSLRQDYAEDVSKYLLAEKSVALYEKAIEVALALYQKTRAEEYFKEAFLFAEKNKSVSLLESIRQNTAMGFGHLPDSLLEKEKSLRSELTFLHKLIYLEKQGSPDEDRLQELNARLFESKEDHRELVEELENNFPRYHEIKYRPHWAGVDELRQKALDPQTALLEYFVGEEQIYLFGITREGAKAVRIPKGHELLESFTQLRNILNAPPDGKTYADQLARFNRIAPQLFTALLEPALSLLEQKEKLILIPDDWLNYLPFEILTSRPAVDATSGYDLAAQQYLFEDFSISYNFSASLLLQNHGKAYQAPQPFAGFAPRFQELAWSGVRGCEDGQLYRLQCNQQEVEDLSRLMAGEAFLGNSAGKDQFLRLSGQYDILHLATHACLDQDHPEFNRIYFTDDHLSNFDLNNCSLRSNLVVLSACNTNSGTLVKGDGVMSLAKGFTLAGCPSTVTSLWAVDDCSTSEFMLDFYRHLNGGKAKDQALRAAKVDYLGKADKVTAHPYYWAPFLQFGNTAPLQQDRSFRWWLWGGMVLLLLFLFFRYR